MTRRRGRARFLVAPVAAAACLAAGSCGNPNEGAIVVAPRLALPSTTAAYVRVSARADGAEAPIACATWTRAEAEAGRVVRVVAAGGAAMRLEVGAFADAPPSDPCSLEGASVVRRARTAAIAGLELLWPAPLSRACVAVTCGDEETCRGGACASDRVDPAALVRYSELSVRGDSSYCIGLGRCFEDHVPALRLGTDDCRYKLTGDVTRASAVNIAVVHDDLFEEILSEDDAEGFAWTSDVEVRLAPGLCALDRAGRLALVDAGVGCPSKSPWMPLCASSPRVVPPDAGAPRLECVAPGALPPRPRAVYLLIDRSASLRPTLASLAPALSLVLRSRVLRDARVAFAPFPSDASACAEPARFAAPEAVGGAAFAAAPALAPSIARLAEALAPAVDRSPDLDAVLSTSGAYAAFAGRLVAGTPEVLLVANRGLVPACTVGGPSLAATSAAARAALGVRTSVILAPVGEGTAAAEGDPYLDAVAIARASEGAFVDTIPDRALRSKGAALWLAQTWPCEYVLDERHQRVIEGAGARLVAMHPVEGTRVAIERVPQCDASVEGFSLTSGRAVLCPRSCAALRELATFTSAYSVEHGAPPVDLPLFVASPCDAP